METKKGISLLLIVLGIAGLVVGVTLIFTGNAMNGLSWVFAILGFIFFVSGIGVLKSAGSSDEEEGE